MSKLKVWQKDISDMVWKLERAVGALENAERFESCGHCKGVFRAEDISKLAPGNGRWTMLCPKCFTLPQFDRREKKGEEDASTSRPETQDPA